MKFIRLVFSVYVISLVVSSAASSKSLEYRAGKTAAAMEYCGHYALKTELYRIFGKSEEHKDAALTYSLSGYVNVDIDC